MRDMLYCTNEDCPHRVRTGAPAEYRSRVSTCAECGSALSPNPPGPHEPAAPTRWPAPLRRRLWITIGLGLLVLLLPLTPSPLVDVGVAKAMGAGSWLWASRHMGPFALGILPILSAFVLVELVTLAVRPWNRRRHGDPGFRHRMTVAAFVMGMLLALLQGYFLAIWVESLAMSPPSHLGFHYGDPALVTEFGLAFRLQYTLTLTAGTAVLTLVALAISRFGVGNGFAVLILLGLLPLLHGAVTDTASWVALGAVQPMKLFFFGIGLVCVLIGIVWALHRPPHWARGDLPLPMPVCGTWPLELAVPIALLPTQLAMIVGAPWMQRLADLLTPGSPHTLRIELGIILLTAPFAAWLFFWRYRPALVAPGNAMAWFRARVYSTGFMLGLALAWYLLHDIAGEHLRTGLTVLLFVIIVAITSDLRAEIHARRHAPGGADLVPLASYQHPVDGLLDLEEQPGRAGAVIQGLRYRSLTYFFGPIVPLRVLGVPDQEDGPENEPLPS